jgi:hypothetical protein
VRRKASTTKTRPAAAESERVRRYADALRALLAYSYAPDGSVELRQALDQLREVLPSAGFSGPPFENDECLRQQLRASFDTCIEGVVWTVPRDAVPLSVTWIQIATDEHRQTAFPMYSGDHAVAFWFSVSHILQQTLPQLAACQCGRKFVRTRPDTSWCTKACGQRVRSRRWYAAHQHEAAERKHHAYVARRRRTHPKAKVARRPRQAASQRIATDSKTAPTKDAQATTRQRKTPAKRS